MRKQEQTLDTERKCVAQTYTEVRGGNELDEPEWQFAPVTVSVCIERAGLNQNLEKPFANDHGHQ